MTILLGFIGSMAYSESGKICLLSLLNSHSLIMVYQGYAVCLMRLTSHIKYQCQTDKYLSFRNPMMNTYCATEAVLNSCHLFPEASGPLAVEDHQSDKVTAAFKCSLSLLDLESCCQAWELSLCSLTKN